MNFETVMSMVALAAFIWSVSFLLPKAVKAHDSLALTSAVLTATLALLLWLLIGVGTS